MNHPTRALGALLLIVHGILAIAGIVGLLELVVAEPPWPRISNALFPRWMLLLEWPLLLAAGGGFIFCYFFRPRSTAPVMAVAYAGMATLCAVQTFGFLQHESRFREMILEYVAYALILLVLFRSRDPAQLGQPETDA